MMQVLLGQRESDVLEFKARPSLDRPESIGREVVAMLNGKGGEVWVGIEERDGCAVRVDPIENPEKARRALHDHLVDTLEPSPTSEECNIEIVQEKTGSAVLRIRMRPSENRKPYALLRGGGRCFFLRVSDRLRLMSREEIFRAYRSPSEDKSEMGRASIDMREERNRRQAEGKDLYWVAIQPVPPLELDVQSRNLREYLQDARRTDNRPDGWNFANPYKEPALKGGRLVNEAPYGTMIEVRCDGRLAFTAPLESLRHRTREQAVRPDALIEYPVALFRLARRLLIDGGVSENGHALADLAIINFKHWELRPYSQRNMHFQHPREKPSPYTEKDLLLSGPPLVFTSREMVQEPDWCGFRIVRCIYEAFGYSEDKIPYEFNRITRRLEIPG